MSIAIHCPDCNRKYIVTEKHVGKKVVCADASCGCSFIAEKPRNAVSDEFDFTYDQSDAEVVPKERPAPPPIARESEPEPEYPFPGNVRRRIAENAGDTSTMPCRFTILGRGLVYCGLLMLVAGAVCPSSVQVKQEDSTSFRLPASMFNLSLAFAKLTIVLMGMTVTVAGAAIWSGSPSGPSKLDVIILRISAILLLLGTFGFVGLMIVNH